MKYKKLITIFATLVIAIGTISLVSPVKSADAAYYVAKKKTVVYNAKGKKVKTIKKGTKLNLRGKKKIKKRGTLIRIKGKKQYVKLKFFKKYVAKKKQSAKPSRAKKRKTVKKAKTKSANAKTTTSSSNTNSSASSTKMVEKKVWEVVASKTLSMMSLRRHFHKL
ncbi:MAG: hypothetical protein Q3960_05115 [Lactobacillus sp.]|nr:hypothetical protein [Lactobacillus sp.]